MPTATTRATERGAFNRATGRGLDGDGDRRNYHRFQHELIAPHCGDSLLEVGAGTGALSARFDGLERLVVSDVDSEAVEHLQQRFDGRAEAEVRPLDLLAGDRLAVPVDSCVSVNVLEHFADDVGVLETLATSLRAGGTVVSWVPGYDWLYGDFDRAVGHHRRYTPETLAAAHEQAGLTVRTCRPVNLLGALAWWVAVRRGGVGAPNPALVRAYDRVVVPATRAIEQQLEAPFGQSVLCVASAPRTCG